MPRKGKETPVIDLGKSGDMNGTSRQELIPQQHGGALLSGASKTNHKPGPGRPKNKFKKSLRGKLLDIADKDGIKGLRAAIAAGNKPNASGWDKSAALKAMEIAFKYGLGEQREIPEELPLIMASVISKYVPAEHRQAAAEELLQRMSELLG